MCYLRVFNNYDVMKELLDLILPRDVLACFEVVKVCTTSARIDIYLDEKNIPPAEYSGQGVLSKGFTVPTSIQDFPLRGRAVYLHVRRRKWQLPSGDVVSNKFSLAADGTRYSREFAFFFKRDTWIITRSAARASRSSITSTGTYWYSNTRNI